MKKLLFLALSVGYAVAGLPPHAKVKELIFNKKCVDEFCQVERQELEQEYAKLNGKQKIKLDASPSYRQANVRYSMCIDKHCMTKENLIAPLIAKIITMASDAAKANVERELIALISVYNQYEPSNQLLEHHKYFLKYFALASPDERIQIIKSKTKDLPQNVVYMMAALMQDDPQEFIKSYRVANRAAWMGALIAKM